MRFDVHNYSLPESAILQDVPMLVLVQHGFVASEWMQDAVLALRVGDEQISDKGHNYIRRVS
jgi:hypothetical protein